MKEQVLKDKNHLIIGYLTVMSNGDKIIKDKNHTVRGYYDAKTDITNDRHHNRVGYGDLLTTLI